ncbi:hypothetical protein NEMIN01_0392 [Nematocida minor]|uniref:uncharacterized protein n=1 Tax=Nematocida minor TaxID=1912983 RepID=UPI00221ECDAD|nr:uncharacterized protein NEMIN01_0392 [Nematocida minor]KAI5189226.1 hypothetical protein NEMIN01_0392 [Nematocida minor]
MTAMKEKNIRHMLLFPLGAAYSAAMAVRHTILPTSSELVNSLFSVCNYSAIVLIILAAIFASKRTPLDKLQKIYGSVFIGASFYLFLHRLSASPILARIAIFAQNYLCLYFVVGSIFMWDSLPFISILSKELSPNTHWDFKLGYFVLNISIYSTHTYSLHFFNSQLDLPVADYGFFGCMSIFYIANTIIGPIAERHNATKKATLLFSFLSALVYTFFIVIRAFKEQLSGLFTICSVFSLYVIILSPIFPLYDVLVMHHLSKEYRELEKTERKEIFTRIRMWASIGHAMSGIVISYIYKTLDMSNGVAKKDDSSLQFFILIAVVIISTAMFIHIVNSSLEEKTDAVSTQAKQKTEEEIAVEKTVLLEETIVKQAMDDEIVKQTVLISQETISAAKKTEEFADQKTEKNQKDNATDSERTVRIESRADGKDGTEGAQSDKPQNLLKSGNFWFLGFVIAAIGATRGISSHFLVTYLSVYFDVKFSKVTSILCIRTFSEMCILYYSKHLLKYFGYYWLLLFSLLAATLRDFNYSLLPTNNTILFATANEVLKGISSSCLTFSAVNIVDELADHNNKALAQTFYSGVYNGISILLSSIMSICIIRVFRDFRSLFHVSSTIGFICSCIVIVKYGFIDNKLTLRRRVK